MLLSKIRENTTNLKPCGSDLSKSLRLSPITHIGCEVWKVKKFSTAQ
jgi:hypothetical protein